MTRRLLAAAFLLSLAALPTRALACAGCRNPSLAGARGGQGSLAPGALRLGLSLTGTAIHVVHEAGCRDVELCSELPVQPLYLHDQRIYPLEARLVGEYGINKTFGVEAQLPLRAVRTTIEYTTPEGDVFEPLDEGVHHRDETVLGIADPWLLFRIGGTVEKTWLAARPGVSIPLGGTEENPFELGDQGLQHQHIQLGSGTFDPVVVLEASRSFGTIDLQLFAQGQVPLYENTHGYHAPWRIYGGSAVGTTLVEKLKGFVGVETFHESAEQWDGKLRQDGNLGRSEVLASLMLSQTFGVTELMLSVKLPVFRHIVVGDEPPGTLSSPAIVSLSVTQVVGGSS